VRYSRSREPEQSILPLRHGSPPAQRAPAEYARPDLINCEEDWTFRAVLVGMLREAKG
jgi:hypothetical protein